jgi:hypothetical protein
MKVVAALLLASAHAAPAPEAAVVLPYAHHAFAPLTYGAAVHTPLVHGAVVHTGNAVPVAVGGYKAEAGCNGALCGPVHEVPAQFGALALAKQESSGAVRLTTGTGVLAHHYYGKREAEPAVQLLAHPYALPYAHALVPATQTITYKTHTPTIETNVVATNQAVPVAVGGYKAVAGNNGALIGAVHEVPALFGAPALQSQVNDASQGSLTVGTGAVVTHSLGEPIVKEHTVQVPAFAYSGHHYGKREADADPYYGYYGHGYGHGHGSHGYTYSHGLGYGYGYGLGGHYYG